MFDLGTYACQNVSTWVLRQHQCLANQLSVHLRKTEIQAFVALSLQHTEQSSSNLLQSSRSGLFPVHVLSTVDFMTGASQAAD